MAQRTDSVSELAAQLRALPDAGIGVGWPAVRTRLERRRHRDRIRRRAGTAAAIATLGTIALLVGSRLADAPQRTHALHATAPAPVGTADRPAAEASSSAGEAELGSLRARSLALEDLLAQLPDRPAVGRAGTSVPVDELEAQVQWLDHQLNLVVADPVSAPAAGAQAERLWRERNETLDALLLLRYAEIQSRTL